MSSGGVVAATEGKPPQDQLLAGKYRIERQLGQGGMGVVFAATHVLTGRRVAIKWMLAASDTRTTHERSERFLREARAAGCVDHPNVVQVLDVGDDARGPFIVMEFLHGETLAALLARMRLSPAEAIDLLMPALRGVHAAHQQGVVHRDLKPDNVFLCRTRDGSPAEAKVLDFGISKLTFDSEPVNTLTRPGTLIGSAHYMAPERVRGQRETDRRSDVYAFGVILYEVLTGELPFSSPHVGDLIVSISTQTPLPLRAIDPSIPAALEAVVLKAMARRAQDRYPDLESLGRALEPFAGVQRFSVQMPEPTGRHRTDRPPPSEDAATHALVPSISGERPTTLDPITTIAPPGLARSRRLVIGAAVLIAAGIGLTALLHAGDDDPPSSPPVAAAAQPPVVPPPVARPVVPEAAPVAAPPAAEQPTATKRPAKTAAQPTELQAAKGAKVQPARVPAATRRVRVARGVRTRGLSEQDF